MKKKDFEKLNQKDFGIDFFYPIVLQKIFDFVKNNGGYFVNGIPLFYFDFKTFSEMFESHLKQEFKKTLKRMVKHSKKGFKIKDYQVTLNVVNVFNRTLENMTNERICNEKLFRTSK